MFHFSGDGFMDLSPGSYSTGIIFMDNNILKVKHFI